MTYDWEPYKEICYEIYVVQKQSLRKLHAYLNEHHNFDPSLRGLHHRLTIWKFPAKHNPAYKNEALVARIKELWETNHQVRDMIAVLTDEGFEVQERDVNRIRQKNGWLLRMDAAHLEKKKPRASQAKKQPAQAVPPEDDSEDDDDEESLGGEGTPNTAAHPDFDNLATPSAALADLDLTQAQAEAFQEARKRAIAADAERKRVTKKRRRWMRGRAGLPADPPGPPRFPSELSLTECKAVLAVDAASYKDVRAKFRRICESENVIKKTIAGPHKWEAIKLQLVRESMHLRGVFWDQLNVDQKNLALDLICCDVTKSIRQEGSRMMLHEARNILALNPKMGRDVRFHFQKILAEDHFVGKIVAGEEHWNEMVNKWLAESEVLGPVATSLNTMDPDYAQKKKAIEVVARDAMKRFRDAELRGVLGKMLAYDRDGQEDAHGETDDEAAVGNDTTAMNAVMDMTGFDSSVFGADDNAQIAAQLSIDEAATYHQDQPVDPALQPPDYNNKNNNDNNQGQNQPETLDAAPPKRKRGRPRKLPYPEPLPEGAEPPPKKKRGRKSKRIPQEEALAIYAHSQARFVPPDATRESEATTTVNVVTPGQPAVGGVQQYTPTPAPVTATSPSPARTQASAAASSTPAQLHAQLQAQSQVQTQARAQARPLSQFQSTPKPNLTSTPRSASAHTPTPAPTTIPAFAPAPASAATPSHQLPATAIYFRLAPTSAITGLPGMWIATLASRSVVELRQKAVAKAPAPGLVSCAVVDGIVKDGMGGEIPLPIPGDVELGAYLDHMREVHGPPTFSVRLVGA